MDGVTFSNAWDQLGRAWYVSGNVPNWAQGRVYVCPVCLGPAVATDVYVGGRGDLPRLECPDGHMVERDEMAPEVIVAHIAGLVQATRAWPTGQSVWLSPDLWLTAEDGTICLCRTQRKPRMVGVCADGERPWRPLPAREIRQAIAQLKGVARW